MNLLAGDILGFPHRPGKKTTPSAALKGWTRVFGLLHSRGGKTNMVFIVMGLEDDMD